MNRVCERCRVTVLSSGNHSGICYPCQEPDRLARRDWPGQKRTRAPLGDRWARLYDRCVLCGGTDEAHHSHGRCLRCRSQGRSENDRMEVRL